MRLVLILLLLIGIAAGCGSDDVVGPADARRPSMQVLHIVGAVGTFAYFQLLWPQVEIALADNPDFATIEPSASGFLIPADHRGNREWFATSFAPWIDAAGTPYPGMEVSAFLSGSNQTHTQAPTSNAVLGGTGVVAAIAAHQTTFGSATAPLVVVNNPNAFIGNAPAAPTPAHAVDAAAMVSLYQSTAGVDLTPTQDELDLFEVAGAPTTWLEEFGRQMIVAARAFRGGYSSSIHITLPGTDPHGAFTDIPGTTAILASLQTILNGFHTLLAGESHDGKVTLTILGDTPKSPLQRSGWPDGTPGGSNWVYVVGKGHLKHGWFGRVHADGSVSSYDPVTGADDPNRTSASTTLETAAAITYAATRGDAAYVESLGGSALSEYEGVVNTGVRSVSD